MKALLSIGRLTSVELLDPDTGKVATIRPKGKWLAWDRAKKNFAVCTIKGRTTARLPTGVIKQHSKFHNAPPGLGALTGNNPAASGALKPLGLVKALVYVVPKNIHSPNKNGSIWHHSFGDTGHRGGAYSPKVMPLLMQDRNGNLFFKRRRGNIYRVDEWLRG